MLGFSPLFHRLAFGAFLVALIWLAPLAEAHATVYSYTVCINWQIRTTDSSFGIQAGPDINVTEDYYQGCNGTCDVTARGVRIKVAQGAWSSILNTNPTSGCTTFNRTDPPSHTYSITTYAYSTDANGNYARLHDSPNKIKGDNNDYYPGATISHLQNNVALTPGGGANVIAFGGGGADWTAMAAAAFTLYRYHPGLSNKQIHIASNTAGCSLGTAHYSTSTYTGSRYESNSKITSGKHYVKIDTCPTGGTPIARAKFTVAHEVGHAILALYYGAQVGASDYTEPAVESAFNNNTAGMPNYCYDGSSTYSYRSKEWNAVAYREGFAHFVSAATWNVKQPSGSFYWGAVPSTNYPPTDFWRFGPSYEQSGSNAAGGLLEQVCDGDNDDAATNEDMVRFFWSFYNANSGTYCGSGETPTAEQMLKLYARVRLNGGLTEYNYMASTESAAEQIGLPSCLAQAGTSDEYNYYQEHHGVDH